MRQYRQLTEEDRIEIYAMKQAGKQQNDTLVGKNHQGALVTLVDRKSKLTLIGKVRRYTADEVEQVITGLMSCLPKRSDIRAISDERIEFIMNRLNNRPRKSLGFLTPNEVFYK